MNLGGGYATKDIHVKLATHFTGEWGDRDTPEKGDADETPKNSAYPVSSIDWNNVRHHPAARPCQDTQSARFTVLSGFPDREPDSNSGFFFDVSYETFDIATINQDNYWHCRIGALSGSIGGIYPNP